MAAMEAVKAIGEGGRRAQAAWGGDKTRGAESRAPEVPSPRTRPLNNSRQRGRGWPRRGLPRESQSPSHPGPAKHALLGFRFYPHCPAPSPTSPVRSHSVPPGVPGPPQFHSPRHHCPLGLQFLQYSPMGTIGFSRVLRRNFSLKPSGLL